MAEDLLKPGHLSRLLEEDLSGDVSCLSLAEVIGVTRSLLERLRSYRDMCPARHLGVRFFFQWMYATLKPGFAVWGKKNCEFR